MLKVGSRRRADALDGDESPDEQHQVGRELQPVAPHHRQRVLQQAGDRQVAHRDTRIAVDQVREIPSELGAVECLEGPADRQDGRGKPLGVFAGDRVEQANERVAEVAVDPADAAEVEQADHAARQDEDVGRVRVGVEQAVAKHLLQDRLGAALCDRRDIERPGVGQHVLQPRPLHVLHRQHAGRRLRPVHPRETYRGVAGEVLREPVDGAPLAGKVLLAPNRAGEFGHEHGRLVNVRVGQVPLRQPGEQAEYAEVVLDEHLDAGAPNLDRDFAAVEQGGAVHLGDGRGSDRFRIEPREHLGDGAPQLGFDGGLGHPVRERRHGVLQAGEFGDEVRGKQVGSIAEGLAELDEGGSQLLEGLAEPLRLGAGRGGAAAPRAQAPPEGDRSREPEPRDDVAESRISRGRW